jgi:putative FmdB family regulatory protein
MPLYVYKCKDCGREIEILQAFGDPKPSCEQCLCEMQKQVALTSFSLKGGGWAKDNYGLKNG